MLSIIFLTILIEAMLAIASMADSQYRQERARVKARYNRRIDSLLRERRRHPSF